VITAIRFVFLATLGSWIGIMAFLSFVVAPAAFGVLDAPQAGDVVGAIFPRYYAIGVSLGVAAIAAALFLRARSERPRAWALAVLALLVAVAAAAWAGVVVPPEARRLRGALRSPAATEELRSDFARVHRTAVALNLIAMLAAVTSLGAATTGLRQ
jgi:uncharacterized membrane protein